jgi:hypothetical protein
MDELSDTAKKAIAQHYADGSVAGLLAELRGQLGDTEKKALWRNTWERLPLIAATIVVFNVLPALVLWQLPTARGWLSYAIWLVLSTILTAFYALGSGVIIINGQARSFWAPWQAVIACAIDLFIVCGFLWSLPHLPN